MNGYELFKVFAFAMTLWGMFFLNLLLPKFIDGSYFMGATLWTGLYMIFLILAVLATLVFVAELAKHLKKDNWPKKFD